MSDYVATMAAKHTAHIKTDVPVAGIEIRAVTGIEATKKAIKYAAKRLAKVVPNGH